MPEPNENDVLVRAKELAEHDGYPWDIEFKSWTPGTKVVPQPYLDPGKKQQYLDRARAELREGIRDA